MIEICNMWFLSFSYDWHWNFVFIKYVNLYAKITKLYTYPKMIKLTMKYLYFCPELKEIKLKVISGWMKRIRK